MQSKTIENHGNINLEVGDILFNQCFPHKPPQYFKVLHIRGTTLTVKPFWYRQIKNECGRFYTIGVTSLFYKSCAPSCLLANKEWYLSEI